MKNCTDITKVAGRRSLFVGTESYAWTPISFVGVAQFARSHGIDSLLIKVADGVDRWYGGIAGYRARRDAIKSEGVGVIPYAYSYGDKFGVLSAEIDILKEFMQEDGVVCADMEAEWNGQVQWATQLFGGLRGVPGIFLVSTWANPAQQGWGDIVKALNPIVAAWMPQQYTLFLASQWAQFGDLGASCLAPTVNLTDGFGINDPVAIASAAYMQGHATLSLWHHASAMNNPGLVDQVLAAFPKIQGGNDMLQITDDFAARHFVEIPGTTPPRWHCTAPGHDFDIIGGILDYYQVTQGAFRLPCSDEIYGVLPGASLQLFEGGVLVWDPSNTLDNPGLGPAYAMHLNENSEGLRRLCELAGLAVTGQIAVPADKIADATMTINAAIAALQNAKQDLAIPEIAVTAK